MKINRYFKNLRNFIEANPLIVSYEIYEDQRTDFEGAIKARINFIDTSFLEFREYVNTRGAKIQKYAYSYHYQKSKRLVFRYDNAPHHPEIPSFPDHKHISKEKIIESSEVNLKMV